MLKLTIEIALTFIIVGAIAYVLGSHVGLTLAHLLP